MQGSITSSPPGAGRASCGRWIVGRSDRQRPRTGFLYGTVGDLIKPQLDVVNCGVGGRAPLVGAVAAGPLRPPDDALVLEAGQCLPDVFFRAIGGIGDLPGGSVGAAAQFVDDRSLQLGRGPLNAGGVVVDEVVRDGGRRDERQVPLTRVGIE